VHARQEPVDHEEHDCYCGLNASFKEWQGRGKKRRTEGMNLKVNVMARYLLETWGFGVKSAHEVQREAAMAVANGADQPDLAKLAGLGKAEHDEGYGYMRPKKPGNNRARPPSRREAHDQGQDRQSAKWGASRCPCKCPRGQTKVSP